MGLGARAGSQPPAGGCRDKVGRKLLPHGGQSAEVPAAQKQQEAPSAPGGASEEAVAACLALLADKGVVISDEDRAKLAPKPPAKEVKPKTYPQVLQSCIWKLEKPDKQAAAKEAAHKEAAEHLEQAKAAVEEADAVLEAARQRQAEGREALEQAERMQQAGLPPGSNSAWGVELAKAIAGPEALGAIAADGDEAAGLQASRAVLQRKVDAIRAEIEAERVAVPSGNVPMGGERSGHPAGSEGAGGDHVAFFARVDQFEGENLTTRPENVEGLLDLTAEQQQKAQLFLLLSSKDATPPAPAVQPPPSAYPAPGGQGPGAAPMGGSEAAEKEFEAHQEFHGPQSLCNLEWWSSAGANGLSCLYTSTDAFLLNQAATLQDAPCSLKVAIGEASEAAAQAVLDAISDREELGAGQCFVAFDRMIFGELVEKGDVQQHAVAERIASRLRAPAADALRAFAQQQQQHPLEAALQYVLEGGPDLAAAAQLWDDAQTHSASAWATTPRSSWGWATGTRTGAERLLFHAQLYCCFAASQLDGGLELVVVDTGLSGPSPMLRRLAEQDDRVVYRHFAVPSHGWPVGLKRNSPQALIVARSSQVTGFNANPAAVALHLSLAPVVAHFDDDDLYAPEYLARMLDAMGDADAVTLSSWFVFDTLTGRFAQVDPLAELFYDRGPPAPPSPPLAPLRPPPPVAGWAEPEPAEPSLSDRPLEFLWEHSGDAAGWRTVLWDEGRRCFSFCRRSVLPPDASCWFFSQLQACVPWQALLLRAKRGSRCLADPGTSGIPIVRHTAWYTRDRRCRCEYTYGMGARVPSAGEVRGGAFGQVMEQLFACVFGAAFPGLPPEAWPDCANLNLYEDGSQGVGWHADDELLFQGATHDCPISSLGGTREFWLAQKLPSGAPDVRQGVVEVDLGDGDLITMEGLTQKHCSHAVPFASPQDADRQQPRINVTFRWLRVHKLNCPLAVVGEERILIAEGVFGSPLVRAALARSERAAGGDGADGAAGAGGPVAAAPGGGAEGARPAGVPGVPERRKEELVTDDGVKDCPTAIVDEKVVGAVFDDVRDQPRAQAAADRDGAGLEGGADLKGRGASSRMRYLDALGGEGACCERGPGARAGRAARREETAGTGCLSGDLWREMGEAIRAREGGGSSIGMFQLDSHMTEQGAEAKGVPRRIWAGNKAADEHADAGARLCAIDDARMGAREWARAAVSLVRARVAATTKDALARRWQGEGRRGPPPSTALTVTKHGVQSTRQLGRLLGCDRWGCPWDLQAGVAELSPERVADSRLRFLSAVAALEASGGLQRPDEGQERQNISLLDPPRSRFLAAAAAEGAIVPKGDLEATFEGFVDCMPPGSRRLDQFASLPELQRHIREVRAPPPPGLVSTEWGGPGAPCHSQKPAELDDALRSRSGDRAETEARGGGARDASQWEAENAAKKRFPALVRAALKNAQGLAALEAAIYHIMHLDRDHQGRMAMRATAKYYVDEANSIRRDSQQQLRDHQPAPELDALGVPHPHLRLALVGGVAQQGERIGAVNHAALKQLMDQIEGDPAIANETLCMQVRHCRISFARDRELMNILVVARNAGVQLQLLDSIQQLGAKLMNGGTATLAPDAEGGKPAVHRGIDDSHSVSPDTSAQYNTDCAIDFPEASASYPEGWPAAGAAAPGSPPRWQPCDGCGHACYGRGRACVEAAGECSGQWFCRCCWQRWVATETWRAAAACEEEAGHLWQEVHRAEPHMWRGPSGISRLGGASAVAGARPRTPERPRQGPGSRPSKAALNAVKGLPKYSFVNVNHGTAVDYVPNLKPHIDLDVTDLVVRASNVASCLDLEIITDTGEFNLRTLYAKEEDEKSNKSISLGLTNIFDGLYFVGACKGQAMTALKNVQKVWTANLQVLATLTGSAVYIKLAQGSELLLEMKDNKGVSAPASILAAAAQTAMEGKLTVATAFAAHIIKATIEPLKGEEEKKKAATGSRQKLIDKNIEDTELCNSLQAALDAGGKGKGKAGDETCLREASARGTVHTRDLHHSVRGIREASRRSLEGDAQGTLIFHDETRAAACDTRPAPCPPLVQDARGWVYGYGFSYLYRREAALQCPFPDGSFFAEDSAFMHGLQLRGGGRGVALTRDDVGLALHMQHGGNLSNSHAHVEVAASEMAAAPVSRAPGFEWYVTSFRPRPAFDSPHLTLGAARFAAGAASPRDPARLCALLASIGVVARCRAGRPGAAGWCEDAASALVSFSVRLGPGRWVEEPGRVLRAVARFSAEALLPADVPRAQDPARLALLHVARLLLRRTRGRGPAASSAKRAATPRRVNVSHDDLQSVLGSFKHDLCRRADLDLVALVEAGGRDADKAIQLAMPRALEKVRGSKNAKEDEPALGDLLFGDAASSSGEADPVARRPAHVDIAAFTELGRDAAGTPWSMSPRGRQRIIFGRLGDHEGVWEMLASLHSLRRSRHRDLLCARIGQFLMATQQSVNATGSWRLAWLIAGLPGPRPGAGRAATGRAHPAESPASVAHLRDAEAFETAPQRGGGDAAKDCAGKGRVWDEKSNNWTDNEGQVELRYLALYSLRGNAVLGCSFQKCAITTSGKAARRNQMIIGPAEPPVAPAEAQGGDASLKRLLSAVLRKSTECRQKVAQDNSLTTELSVVSELERKKAAEDQYKEVKTSINEDVSQGEDIDFYERAKFVPMRLTYDERKYLRLIDATMHVSHYTDHMDNATSVKISAPRKLALQMKQLCAILSGMQVAHSYEQGQQLMQSREFSGKAAFFQTGLEIGRRYKILNPERMRDSYGKLMYFLQDSRKTDVRELIEFDSVVRVRTVYDVLSKTARGLEMLEDSQLRTATMEIMPEGKSRMQIQREIKAKEAAIKSLSKTYCSVARRRKHHGFHGYSIGLLRSNYADSDSEDDAKNGEELTEDLVEQCIYSLGDHSTYLRFNREPCDRLITFLKEFFDPVDPGPPQYSLAIEEGVDGARLSHPHTRQYTFVLQSMTLWREVLDNMFQLWHLAEEDLLDEEHCYQLTDTGQGLQRVQKSPRSVVAMQKILAKVQRKVGGWIGSSTVHLGDHNVPNALMFIDKYIQ
ncbi:unnamed protein product, partial [Prorocentrum cordatum]